MPEGWAVAPDELKAGLDYSTPELTDADLRALREWYERVLGEVPKSIELYAKYRPQLLKAERNRWENIVRTGLPNQMLAYLMIHYEVWRGNRRRRRVRRCCSRAASGCRSSTRSTRSTTAAPSSAAPRRWLPVADTVEEVLDAW